jgi:hypothetical protein
MASLSLPASQQSHLYREADVELASEQLKCGIRAAPESLNENCRTNLQLLIEYASSEYFSM